MKLLLDSCVSWRAKAQVQAHGHDVEWVGDWVEDPGDEEILRRAYTDGRVLVTLDSDFGELAYLHGLPHCGMVRLVGIPDHQHGATCVAVLSRFTADLVSGAVLTVESFRVRVRPPDQDT